MEGPGVYLIKERLSFLKGKKILRVGGNTKENKEILLNQEIQDIKSLGKRLIFEFSDHYLLIHFLMYGSLRLNEKDKGKKERLQLVFKDNVLNFYNTSVKIVKKSDFLIDPSIDVMSKDFDLKRAKFAFRRHEGLVSDLLLDQNVFAGVGNIIKNEALFRARVHPLSISKNIDDNYVNKLIKEVLDFSYLFYLCRKNGVRLKNHLLIYGKRECPICHSRLKVKNLGQNKRRTYFCDNCQILF